MSKERLTMAGVVSVLLLVGALAWWLQLQPKLRVDATELAALPYKMGVWKGRGIALESAVEVVLRADFNLQRAYVEPSGGIVWLYIGYYGTSRGGRPEHTPRGCYTGAGWIIEGARTVEVAPATGFRVNEYTVERNGERRLVHFWYRSHRSSGLLGGLDRNLDRLWGRLYSGRADGALIRISTPVEEPGDEVIARGRLISFATDLESLVAARWPDEHPVLEDG